MSRAETFSAATFHTSSREGDASCAVSRGERRHRFFWHPRNRGDASSPSTHLGTPGCCGEHRRRADTGPGAPSPLQGCKTCGVGGEGQDTAHEQHRGWGCAAFFSPPSKGWAHPGRQAPQRLSVIAVPGATRILFPARQRV